MPAPVDPARALEPPVDFQRSVDELRNAPLRPEIVVRPAPSPTSIAPFAEAITLDIGELATARLVYLHDPAGQEAWAGCDRFVGFARSSVESEMALDPMLAEVVWSWLSEALAGRGLTLHAAAGTVTTTSNTRFGAIASSGPSHELELRCSWSPNHEVGEHTAAFGDLLAMMAGLPPDAPEVVALRGRSSRD